MITLRIGEIGPLVEMLQLALQRAGLETEINGGFNEELERVVKEFQRENNLEPDGVVGKNTWARLEPYLLGYTTNSQGEKVPLDFDIVPTNIRYVWELVSYIVKGITARYPFVESGSIGKSIMGKDLYYLKIGTGPVEAFYNGEHHANEWITTPLLLKFAEEYAKAYTNDGNIGDISARELYDSKTLYIVACVNPDGMDVVNGGLPAGEYYNNVLEISGNYPQIPFPDGWKANVEGVDLNLNYPANWNRAKEIKYSQGFTSPAPRDFVGTEPLSEPESLAMYNFTTKHNFTLTLSYHTQGKVIYWKYLDYLPKNSYAIARALAEVSGYELSLTPSESAYAGYKDWFIQAYNKPGYTIEAGTGINPLPLEQFDEIYNDNLGLLVTALEMA
ncbi:MAG: M14 family zinc carboxypeptidase [Clostridia bacterium]|nr:M14 family zinc carboxypeptidase [Clostridia bacterium]